MTDWPQVGYAPDWACISPSMGYIGAMKLRDYLAHHRLTARQFGATVGHSEAGVRKWLRGDRVPRRETLKRIALVTGNAVTATDFLDVPERRARVAA